MKIIYGSEGEKGPWKRHKVSKNQKRTIKRRTNKISLCAFSNTEEIQRRHREEKRTWENQEYSTEMSLLARPEVAVAVPLTGSLQVGLKINFLFFFRNYSRSHTAFFIYDKKILLRKKINISYFLFSKIILQSFKRLILLRMWATCRRRSQWQTRPS